MRNRNIALIILGSALVIVLLAFIGRWTLGTGRDNTPSVPDTGGTAATTTSTTGAGS